MTSEAENGTQMNLDLGEEVPYDYDPGDFTEAEAGNSSPTATTHDTTVQPPKPERRRLWKSPAFIAIVALLCIVSFLLGKASSGIVAHKQAAVEAEAASYSVDDDSPRTSKASKMGKGDADDYYGGDDDNAKV